MKIFPRNQTEQTKETNSAGQMRFYKMLLKFKNRHPNFDADNLFKKLYPQADIPKED